MIEVIFSSSAPQDVTAGNIPPNTTFVARQGFDSEDRLWLKTEGIFVRLGPGITFAFIGEHRIPDKAVFKRYRPVRIKMTVEELLS